ncbi:MAG: sulfatase-like hydrolase/transferase, partial [Dysosmobacter sp.]|nr:sulfatase-like hydrolase/transferase [Dysosmobacter sp.]
NPTSYSHLLRVVGSELCLRESGRADPYYGGLPGSLKGHKFSLFEGGIRVPGIFCWPDGIPAGQVIGEPCAAMDVFPTLLKLAGGKPEEYELDGKDILPVLTGGAPTPHGELYWEMERQTAVRQGDYKLVLDGQLVEGEPPQASVFLSDLSVDPGETTNLAEQMPELAAPLREKALGWRAGIEENWNTKFADAYKSTT